MVYRDLSNKEIASVVAFAITYDCEKARRMFSEKFDKEPPPARTLLHWKNRYLETLSVGPRERKGDHSRRRVSDVKRTEVIAAFEDDPSTSQRKVIAQEVGLAQSSVHKVLKEEGIKHWKHTIVQELKIDDIPTRLQFCRLMIERHTQDPSFIFDINFSDEATFHLNGSVNRHNCFVYARTNPHLTDEKPMRSPSIVCIYR